MLLRTPQTQGFTLLEAIIVVAIVATLAVFVTSSWQGNNIALVTVANQVGGDIRYTQALSMSSGQRYRLVITSSTSYQILNASGAAIVMPMGGTSTTLAGGISFGTLSNLPNRLIAFDTQGAPYVDSSSPGTALTAIASIPVISSTQTRTVSISPNTGRVIVQ